MVWLCLLGCGVARGGEYSNRELNFRVRLPDGYENVSGASRPNHTLVMKARYNRDRSVSRLLSIQDLGEVIRQDADLSRLKRRTGNVTQEKLRWRDFEVDVFSVTEGEAGLVFVSLNAQVPLRTRGIQLSMSALKTEERALRQELGRVLASIDGPSNWVSDREHEERESSGNLRTTLTLAGLVVLVGAALWGISKVQG